MIEGLSHITIVVKDLARTAAFINTVFDAKEVYSSGDKTHSLSKEMFFTIGGIWLAVMEGAPSKERTYGHIAFKIPEEEFEVYVKKVEEAGAELLPGRERTEGEGRSLYFYDFDGHLFELHTSTLDARLAFYSSDAKDIVIRPALTREHALLTEISFAAKRYWNYPEEYYRIWEKELTITPAYIEENCVFAAEKEGVIAGYISVVEVKEDFWAGKVFVEKGFWVEHLFIRPEHIKKGIGTKLMAYVMDFCRARGIRSLRLFSDPNAKGFYEKLGAKHMGESPSSIEGRTVSVYEIALYEGLYGV